jgi:hypothetical protein
VFQPLRLTIAPPPPITLSRADYVRTLGDSRAAELEPAAQRHATGPEAMSQRRIRSLTDQATERLRALEARFEDLPVGSRDRREIAAQIDVEVNTFESMIAYERSWLVQQNGGRSSESPLMRALPPYFREAAEREGVVIPGVPGAITPRTSAPYGVDWKIKF